MKCVVREEGTLKTGREGNLHKQIINEAKNKRRAHREKKERMKIKQRKVKETTNGNRQGGKLTQIIT